jgi:GGDEF domain-containing protein
MLDIDNFKNINDTLGHSAGDALLVNIAQKLKYALRTDDLCGRLGGDEFVICLRHMNLGKPLEARINDLCSLVCDEQIWGVPCRPASASPASPTTADVRRAVQKSDVALVHGQGAGRGCFALYDPQLSFDDILSTTKKPLYEVTDNEKLNPVRVFIYLIRPARRPPGYGRCAGFGKTPRQENPAINCEPLKQAVYFTQPLIHIIVKTQPICRQIGTGPPAASRRSLVNEHSIYEDIALRTDGDI